jgi:hypothetical protein
LAQGAAIFAAKTVAFVANAFAASAATTTAIAKVASLAAFYGTQLAISAGLSYAINAATRPKSQGVTGGELQLAIDTDFPRQMIIGRRAVAGSLVAHFSTGSNNNNLHLVYALADHPCVSLEKVYADGREVRSTPLSHGTRTEITAYSYSGGARVWMTFWDGGAGQSADTNLIAASGGEWTSDHKGAGVAYIHVELQIDSDILTSVPSFLFELKGARLYNRRKDSTSGGSGSHRLADPSTWEYSTNPMDALSHYALGYKVESDPLAFGIGLLPEEIPYDQYAAAADLCDEDVTTGTAGAVEVIKRYAANGIVGADQFFEDVLSALQLQMGARIVDLGGRLGVLPAEARPTVVDLTDGDLVDNQPFQFEDKRRFAELVGAVEGRYSDPANLFAPQDYERQEAATLALTDGGETQTSTIEFPFETHPRRAARLARIWLDREQRQGRISGRFDQSAYALEPGDWFTYTSEVEQLESETFEVIDLVKHDDFSVTLTAQAIDPDFVAFDNDNDPDLSVPPYLLPESLLLVAPTFTVAAASLALSGSVAEPAITFTLTSTDRVARELVIEWRRWISGALENISYWDTAHTDQTVTLLRKGILPTTDYKVRAKLRSGRKESPWTAFSAVVTTPALSFDWALIGGSGVPASGATRNALSVSATAPASPANGDLWLDTSTTPYVWKVRSAGAWTSAASLGGIFGATIYESAGVAATLSAFKTSLGVSAGITGQGWGATAAESSASNSFVPNGRNLLINSDWTNGLVGWRTGADGNSGLPVTRQLLTSGFWGATRNNMLISLTGTPAAGRQLDTYVQGPNYFVEPTQTRRYGVPLVGGERVYASALLARHRFSAIHVMVRFVSADEATVSEVSVGSGGLSGGGIGGEPGNYQRVGGFTTAPSWARWMGFYCRGFTDGAADPLMVMTQPFLAIVSPNQTSAPDYTSGPPDRRADATSENTAGAITGQGNFATANFYRQATDPGGVEGRWWVDTTASQLKLYTGGAWNVIADIGGAFYLTPSHTIRQGFISGGGSVTTPSVTVTQAGATGAVSYRWVLVSGDAFTINSPTSNTTSATTGLSSGQDKIGNYMCIGTDAGSGRVSNTIVQFQGTSTS